MAKIKSVKIKKPIPVRDKIMAKARTLFGMKGYHNTTVKEIALAYGCESANIYNFFLSKEEILFEILGQEMEAFVSSIRVIENDETTDPVLQLKTIFACHGKLTMGKMRTSQVLFDGSLSCLNKKHQRIIIEKRDEYDKLLRLVIKRGIDAGIFETTDVKMASFTIASIIVRARVWYKPGGTLSADEIIEALFLFALKALGCRDEKYLKPSVTVK
ncbi:MAG: TetR/AcrR family transcriptional regulator [Desulfobacula sp.]